MGRSGRGASTSSSSSSSSIGHHDQMSMSSSTSNFNNTTTTGSRFFNTDLSTDLKLGLSISPSHQRHFINLHHHSIISNIPRDQLQASSSGHEIWASSASPTADVGEGGSSSDHHDQYYHCNGNNNNEEKIGNKLYVKVYMEGHPIGRKLDILAHNGYPDLITTLDHMFHTNILWGAEVDADTCEDFHHHVLTYEDEEGDWLMVGDVPWEMFLSAVKRLKISRACPC